VAVDLFLGLVTHANSRYPDSSTDDGLVGTVARVLGVAGLSTRVQICAEDSYSPELLDIDRGEIARSIDAELDIEAQWRRYISPRTPKAAMTAFMSARRVYRRRRFLPPASQAVSPDSPGVRMVRRLVNIELSHLSLMRSAVDADAGWALIAEDDAACEDATALAGELMAFMADRSEEQQPKYVNVSRSFEEKRLRIDGLMSPVGAWSDDSNVQIVQSSRPVTNTVCAVLYRGTFLADLVAEMDGIPLSPVLPIDWKLNKALLSMFRGGRLQAGDCWQLSPAPIIQRSMQATS
jgi:hypothetical protein